MFGNSVSVRKPQFEALEPRRMLTAGAPDTHFGHHGRLVLMQSSVFSSDLDTDRAGRIVATLQTADPVAETAELLVARFGPRGTPDLAFGGRGSPVGQVRLPFQDNFPVNAVPLNDGRIVIASGSDALCLRPNGAVDRSWGSRGHLHLRIKCVTDAQLQADGKIVIAGITMRGDHRALALERLRPKGVPDRTFGDRGLVAPPEQIVNRSFDQTTDQQDSRIQSIAFDSAGRIVVSAAIQGVASGSRYAKSELIRFRPGGGLDRSFGSKGITNYTGDQFADRSKVFISPGGSIRVAWVNPLSIGFERLTAQGRAARFRGPKAWPEGPYHGIWFAATAQRDGKLVLTNSDYSQGVFSAVFVRLRLDGQPDPSFGNAGEAGLPFSEPSVGGLVNTVVLTNDGAAIVQAGLEFAKLLLK